MGSRRKDRAATKSKESRRPGRGRYRKASWGVAAVVALVVLVAVSGLSEDDNTAVASSGRFTDVRAQTQEFIDYYNSIELTPEQELVKREALSNIPAPCCSDNTAYTCCCPCNMAKSWWGLTHHLIADEGFDADEVQAAVEEWIDFINPKGFTGNSCYTGGCPRPFHRNGCGGMDENHIVF